MEDGGSGLLFRKGDPHSLAAAIARLAADPALRERLARQGEAKARDFTFKRMVESMERFLVAPR